MKRFDGTVAPLCHCPGWESVATWILGIPFQNWPQQHRLADNKLRPAMVSDLAWHSFGAVTEDLVQMLAGMLGGTPYNRLLSVVMPGATIDPHIDFRAPDVIGRIHVPLWTNSAAWFDCRGESFHLRAGWAYLVNTEAVHGVRNEGATARIHLMTDVRRGQAG